LATEDEFAPAFADCESGAEPPLGGLYEMKTIVDLRLDTPTVTFRGGSHTQTITMSTDDYLEIASADRVDIAHGV
jgi:Ala-tRNA(Pro) deacylase